MNPTKQHEKEDLAVRNNYFSRNRLDRIRRNMLSSSIEVKLGNIFGTIISTGEYNKINLSNCLSYDNDLAGKDRIERLRTLAKILPFGGLIYTSDGKSTCDRAVISGYDVIVQLRKMNLVIEIESTASCQRIQSEDSKFWRCFWKPIVFQKQEQER